MSADRRRGGNFPENITGNIRGKRARRMLIHRHQFVVKRFTGVYLKISPPLPGGFFIFKVSGYTSIKERLNAKKIMLVIRQEQWDAMQNSMHCEFEERCIAELRAFYPERLKTVEDETLREDVRSGLEKAERFGIKDDSFVIEFLKFIVEYGREFPYAEETEWACEILENSFSTEEEKITSLTRHRTLETLYA